MYPVLLSQEGAKERGPEQRLQGEGLWAEGSEYGKAKRADLVRHLGKFKSLTHPTELHHKRADICVCIRTHVHPPEWLPHIRANTGLLPICRVETGLDSI